MTAPVEKPEKPEKTKDELLAENDKLRKRHEAVRAQIVKVRTAKATLASELNTLLRLVERS